MRNDRALLDGTPSVYPGHPVIVAFLIMHEYPNFAAASAQTEYGWADAVGNVNIPCAGGEVRRGLELLRRVKSGVSPEDAVRWGNECWQEGKAGGHPKSVVPGQEQADRILTRFFTKLAEWILTEPEGHSAESV